MPAGRHVALTTGHGRVAPCRRILRAAAHRRVTGGRPIQQAARHDRKFGAHHVAPAAADVAVGARHPVLPSTRHHRVSRGDHICGAPADEPAGTAGSDGVLLTAAHHRIGTLRGVLAATNHGRARATGRVRGTAAHGAGGAARRIALTTRDRAGGSTDTVAKATADAGADPTGGHGVVRCSGDEVRRHRVRLDPQPDLAAQRNREMLRRGDLKFSAGKTPAIERGRLLQTAIRKLHPAGARPDGSGNIERRLRIDNANADAAARPDQKLVLRCRAKPI